MTFKEFTIWCNKRAADGCWGLIEAITCINIISDINKKSFFKRKKAWKEIETKVLQEIVEPINKKIEEYKNEQNSI